MTDSLLQCPCGMAPARILRLGRAGEFLRCQRCGLLARARMPSDEEVTQFYREDYWQWYRDEQVGTARGNVHEHVLAWLERLMPSPGVLVDVGCGGGTLLDLCRARGWKGIGFDPSRQAVAYARARGLDVSSEPFPPCSLADAAADAVTFVNVLDHFRDPFAALQEAWRVLRPGGLLYIRVPNGSFHVGLMPLLSAVKLDDLLVFHLYGFTRKTFLYHLLRAGFTSVRVQAAPLSFEGIRSVTSERTVSVRNWLKVAYRTGDWVLRSFGFARFAYGPSIEAMAVKATASQWPPPQD